MPVAAPRSYGDGVNVDRRGVTSGDIRDLASRRLAGADELGEAADRTGSKTSGCGDVAWIRSYVLEETTVASARFASSRRRAPRRSADTRGASALPVDEIVKVVDTVHRPTRPDPGNDQNERRANVPSNPTTHSLGRCSRVVRRGRRAEEILHGLTDLESRADRQWVCEPYIPIACELTSTCAIALVIPGRGGAPGRRDERAEPELRVFDFHDGRVRGEWGH